MVDPTLDASTLYLLRDILAGQQLPTGADDFLTTGRGALDALDDLTAAIDDAEPGVHSIPATALRPATLEMMHTCIVRQVVVVGDPKFRDYLTAREELDAAVVNPNRAARRRMKDTAPGEAPLTPPRPRRR